MIFRDGELYQILQFLDTPLYVQRHLLDRHENSEFKVVINAMIEHLGRWPTVADAQKMTKQQLASGFEYELRYRGELLGIVKDLAFNELSLDAQFQFVPVNGVAGCGTTEND